MCALFEVFAESKYVFYIMRFLRLFLNHSQHRLEKEDGHSGSWSDRIRGGGRDYLGNET